MANQILIWVGTAVFIGFIYLAFFLWGRWRARKAIKLPKEPAVSQEELESEATELAETPVFVRLYDSLTRIVDNVEIDGAAVAELKKVYGGLGRTWNIDGKGMFAVNKYDIKGIVHYRPVEKMMRPTRDNPPSKVHRALCQPEIAIAFDVSEAKGFLQSILFKVLVWVAIMTFIIFMWSQNLRG